VSGCPGCPEHFTENITPLFPSLLQLFLEKRRYRRDTTSFSLPMTMQTLSDQFNNVEQRFNSERHIYE